MTERKATAPHPLLSRWVKSEGPGAMTRLVKGTGRTWAAVGRVVWHGSVPRTDTAELLSEVTGIPPEAIVSAAVEAREARQQPEAAE